MVAEAPNLCVIYASHSCTLDVGNITKSLYCIVLYLLLDPKQDSLLIEIDTTILGEDCLVY